MQELADIKSNIEVDATVLVVDAMDRTGCSQCSPDFCREGWNRWSDLTKMDGDTRGGAASSIKSVTGKPILYVGMGEKLSDLEQFYIQERMASRILGMGDVMSLNEKAKLAVESGSSLGDVQRS